MCETNVKSIHRNRFFEPKFCFHIRYVKLNSNKLTCICITEIIFINTELVNITIYLAKQLNSITEFDSDISLYFWYLDSQHSFKSNCIILLLCFPQPHPLHGSNSAKEEEVSSLLQSSQAHDEQTISLRPSGRFHSKKTADSRVFHSQSTTVHFHSQSTAMYFHSENAQSSRKFQSSSTKTRRCAHC